MQLHNILNTICGISIFLGIGGLGGCIEFNQGWIATISCFVIAIITYKLARKEEGIRHE